MKRIERHILLLNRRDNILQFHSDGFSNFPKSRIIDSLHRGNRIHGGDFHRTIVRLLNDHITGEHGADLVFREERFVGIRRIACTEYLIGPKIDVELLFSVALMSISVSMPKPSAASASLTPFTVSSNPSFITVLK
jgi:hypothetical protein